MEIERRLLSFLLKELRSDPKTVILYGPRQAGKTTLIQQALAKTDLPFIQLNGDDLRTQELLGRADLNQLKTVVGANRLLVIDEAQRIENIGLTLNLSSIITRYISSRRGQRPSIWQTRSTNH